MPIRLLKNHYMKRKFDFYKLAMVWNVKVQSLAHK